MGKTVTKRKKRKTDVRKNNRQLVIYPPEWDKKNFREKEQQLNILRRWWNQEYDGLILQAYETKTKFFGFWVKRTIYEIWNQSEVSAGIAFDGRGFLSNYLRLSSNIEGVKKFELKPIDHPKYNLETLRSKYSKGQLKSLLLVDEKLWTDGTIKHQKMRLRKLMLYYWVSWLFTDVILKPTHEYYE